MRPKPPDIFRCHECRDLSAYPDVPKLYVILSTWNEADVIAANVKNCLAHGADRVLLLDNASEDDTVEIAEAAGAELVHFFQTDYYEEELRVELVNSIIHDTVVREQHPCLWFMALDADEFIQVPDKKRLKDFLVGMVPLVRTVGFNSIEHMPSEPVANVPGEHPAKYQPMVWKRYGPVCCGSRHFKHCLIRYDNGIHDLIFSRGFHFPYRQVNRPLLEPNATLYLHHFPFRNEADTRKRLGMLCSPGQNGKHRSITDDITIQGEGAIKRYRDLDFVYSQQWDKVEQPHSYDKTHKRGLDVRHWESLYLPREYEVL